jgi:hypothetical protein
MKTCAATMLLLVGACALGADQPGDGIYLWSKDGSAPPITSQAGKKLFLGARQDLKIQSRDLSSRNNANTRFDLSLTLPYDKNIGPSSYILIVSGTAFEQIASGATQEDASQEKTSSISFRISGEKSAQQVSQYLKTPIVYRKHPRHNLLVSFTPTKQEFGIGDEVTATLRITNVGTNTISFLQGGRNRAARDNQYIFCARYKLQQVEDIGTSGHFGGLGIWRVLKPGEVFEDKISLSKWFSFDKAGTYEVHGSYYLDFNDPDDDSRRTIWEDYVSADFIVTIKKQEESSNKKAEATR